MEETDGEEKEKETRAEEKGKEADSKGYVTIAESRATPKAAANTSTKSWKKYGQRTGKAAERLEEAGKATERAEERMESKDTKAEDKDGSKIGIKEDIKTGGIKADGTRKELEDGRKATEDGGGKVQKVKAVASTTSMSHMAPILKAKRIGTNMAHSVAWKRRNGSK